jgi:hypothetical protein
VRAALFLPGLSQSWAVIDFLIDTGASTTCLHPRDALVSVGIDAVKLAFPHHWPASQHQTTQGIGGTCTNYVVPAQYAFYQDDGQVRTLNGTIAIAQLRLENQALPSLLGWDILQHFRLVTHLGKRHVGLLDP